MSNAYLISRSVVAHNKEKIDNTFHNESIDFNPEYNRKINQILGKSIDIIRS